MNCDACAQQGALLAAFRAHSEWGETDARADIIRGFFPTAIRCQSQRARAGVRDAQLRSTRSALSLTAVSSRAKSGHAHP
jgi:hypothetical protein